MIIMVFFMVVFGFVECHQRTISVRYKYCDFRISAVEHP